MIVSLFKCIDVCREGLFAYESIVEPVLLHWCQELAMTKQEGARNSKNMESASSAEYLGSADGAYMKIVRYCAPPAQRFPQRLTGSCGLCDLTHMPKRLRLLTMTEGIEGVVIFAGRRALSISLPK